MQEGGLADPLPDPLAVRPRGPLDSRIRPPGSRSITNRALVAAALSRGTSHLEGVTGSDDTLAMRAGLHALGVGIRAEGRTWIVEGRGGRLGTPRAPLDARESGTTARFLTAAAALASGPVVVDGAPRMRERPIAELVDTLGALGAPGRVLGRGGCPPVRMEGGGLAGGSARIDARRSSQYVSAILLVAPWAERDVELRFVEERLVSRPFVELTLEVMGAFGAEAAFRPDGSLWVRSGTGYHGCRYSVEPDAQAAVYGFAAAAIAGGRVHVEGIPPSSRQTDLRVLQVLEAMGCRVERRPDGVVVEGPAGPLRGVDVDMNDIPDAVLAVAVVALFAAGPSTIRNVANLRIKETDRLAALEKELVRLGARASAGADWLRIEPGPLRADVVESYGDHRMAMSFALAGLRLPGVSIRHPACVAKTWPDFFAVLEGL